MAVISMKALLESGVHFGHRTHKWHPAMKSYIFTERNSIHIIDLQQTVKAIEEAYNLVRDTVAEGGKLLYVGTKRQAQETIQEEAIRAGMPYVTNRWLGGMLTNWRTIRQRVIELERLERMRERGDFERLPKQEVLDLERKMERLEYLFGGIRELTKLPDLLFIIDIRREETAVHEANLLNIPTIALVDTNCDPHNIDFVIPSNDDAIRAIKLLVAKITDAAVEGRLMRKEEEPVERQIEVAIPGLEEPELTDEELLGAATLAKISASQISQVIGTEFEEFGIVEEIVEEVEEEILESDLEDLSELVMEEGIIFESAEKATVSDETDEESSDELTAIEKSAEDEEE